MSRLLLFLTAAQVSSQSPLIHLARGTERDVAAFNASPPPALHFESSNQKRSKEIATSRSSTTTTKPFPNSVLQQRASPSPTLYIKTNASDCNMEGSLGSTMKSSDYSATPTTLNSVMDCEQLCQRAITCYSYSWQMASGGGYNCTMYSTWIGHTPGAVDTGETGLFFSDKHVVDGTIWCYSITPFMGSGLPSGPIIIT